MDFEIFNNQTIYTLPDIELLSLAKYHFNTSEDTQFSDSTSTSSLDISSDSLQDKKGNIHKGTAIINFCFLDSTKESDLKCMPNNFRGIKDGEVVHFESFNALYFDIVDENSGKPLYIRKGSSVGLNIPVSSTNFGEDTYFWEFRNGNWQIIQKINAKDLQNRGG